MKNNRNLIYLAIGREKFKLSGMDDLDKKQVDWSQHRAYCYPPDIITRPIIRHLVPQFDQFILVVNTYKSNSSHFSLARQSFDFCIKIGDYRSPAVITPCRRQWTQMVYQPYYRLYREASSTYLFIKGYSYATVLEFQTKLRRNLYFRGNLVEKAATQFLQKIQWSGRHLFEILE